MAAPFGNTFILLFEFFLTFERITPFENNFIFYVTTDGCSSIVEKYQLTMEGELKLRLSVFGLINDLYLWNILETNSVVE